MTKNIEYIKDNNFNFKNAGITEDEYYNELESISNLQWVSKVENQLSLNDLLIKSHNLNENTIIDFVNHTIPEDMIIRNLFIEDNRLHVSINTSKWLFMNSEKSKHYPGIYKDESIAYLSAEIQSMENFNSTDIIQNKEQLELKIKFDSPLLNTHKFEDIFSFMGYSISRFTIKGTFIKEIYIRFDESQRYNQKNIEKFQKEKYRNTIKKIRGDSKAIKLPSGYRATPDIWMFNQCRDEVIEKFPKVSINAPSEIKNDTIKVYEIPVRNTNDVFTKICDIDNKNLPSLSKEKVSSISIQNGYACPKTNTIYVLPKKSKIFENVINMDDYMTTYEVNYKDNKMKKFELFDYS